MWAERQEKWQRRATSKIRTVAELKEAILNVLKANKGRVISAEELANAMPIRWGEKETFRLAFNELVKERKIKQYIGLP